MSELVYTATFVRLGRSPFGSKPREATVFAQRFEGGSALTWFTNLNDRRIDVRIRNDATDPVRLLMAGFAITEPQLPLEGEARALAERLRAVAAKGEVELDGADAEVLAAAVRELDLALYCTCLGGVVDLDPTSFGAWTVRVLTAG